jgi:beta-mannanase
LRRSKLLKFSSVLTAMLAGAAAALSPTTAHAATAKPCTTDAKLVPSCGVLWGAAAGGFTGAPRDREELNWERLSGRTASIFHTYHKGDELFPTRAEIAMTSDAAHPRVLLTNWKVAYGTTWAAVARGREDRRIDAFAQRAKAYGKKFFLNLNHEPENDVREYPGSGMQASDLAAMFRHTIQRLRADGVTNVISVQIFMSNERWMAQPWWKDLYAGDDVVDWIGLDAYGNSEPGYHHDLFGQILDRGGFYRWATTRHAAKPIFIAEWGAYHREYHAVDNSPIYNSVLPALATHPAVKALSYFDTKHDATGDRDISIDSTRAGLASFRRLAAAPIFNVKLG